jgi:aryl-alcohol dehydrogenase-like predicted oxidoreductase
MDNAAPNAFMVLLPKSNVSDGARFRGALVSADVDTGLTVVPCYALASGILTWKSRGSDDDPSTGRSPKASTHLDFAERVAADRGVDLASIALSHLATVPSLIVPPGCV